MSVQEQIDRLIPQRAAECFEVCRTGQTEKYPAVIAWLAESPRHMAEFLEIARQYPGVRDALRSGAFDIEALLKEQPAKVRALYDEPPTLEQRAEPSALRAPRRPRRWVAAWAAVVVLAAVGTGLWQVFQGVFAGHEYETQIGEQRIVQLSDGSVVTLNAVSRMEVRMDASRRDVVLLRGEAIFKVAHDKTRPFLVHTGHATVRALGTQFNVYARPDGSTTVAVLEGRVEVAATRDEFHEREPLSNIDPVVISAKTALAAGEIAQIERSGHIQRNEKANVSNAVAWRQRRLVFDRTPLEDIVSEFNRYNRNIRLRLVNVPEGTHHYSGGFDADDPRSLALYLSKEPDLVVDQRGGEIIIQGRAPQQ